MDTLLAREQENKAAEEIWFPAVCFLDKRILQDILKSVSFRVFDFFSTCHPEKPNTHRNACICLITYKVLC